MGENQAYAFALPPMLQAPIDWTRLGWSTTLLLLHTSCWPQSLTKLQTHLKKETYSIQPTLASCIIIKFINNLPIPIALSQTLIKYNNKMWKITQQLLQMKLSIYSWNRGQHRDGDWEGRAWGEGEETGKRGGAGVGVSLCTKRCPSRPYIYFSIGWCRAQSSGLERERVSDASVLCWRAYHFR